MSSVRVRISGEVPNEERKEMLPLKRIVNEVLQGKQRTKNRKREHAGHGWKVIGELETVILMDCPCGWVGWIPKIRLER